MAAGERLFVDLLPDGWTGLPPGLPRDVIEELARRARDAERRTRTQRTLAQQNRMAPIRVKVITQPTFTRYVFDLPELIGVSADNTKDKLTLTFDAMLRFDLADVKATLPPTIESIDSEPDQDAVLVRFTFAARVDVRTFREDNSYVVDVEAMERRDTRQQEAVRSDELSSMAAELAERKNAPRRNVAAPRTVPARAGGRRRARAADATAHASPGQHRHSRRRPNRRPPLRCRRQQRHLQHRPCSGRSP